MRFENTEVFNFEGAFRGMRNPKNSWDKSDSNYNSYYDLSSGDVSENELRKFNKELYVHHKTLDGYFVDIIGKNDMKLAQRLIKAGSEHRKFMRQIFVSVDITAPLFWWKEFDTYKVGTVRNSCSTMHKIHVKEFDYDDFTHFGIDECGLKTTFNNYLKTLESLRVNFNETKEKKYWRALIEMLPDGFNMKATVTFDYENLLGICSKGQRRFHKLNEWSGIDYPIEPNFIAWAKTLPYAQELIFIDEMEK
ncbi:hypothetical protein [Eubacterium sp.]